MKIKDSALVAAAELSHRYIADRFLPDKAIDLVDEATSRLAMELESVPTEIDEVQRRLMQLELAARQLADETEEHAQQRLAEINEEMDEQAAKLASLREQWEAEKLGVGDVADVRRKLEEAKLALRPAGRPRSRRSSPPASRSPKSDYQRLYELDVAAEAARRTSRRVRGRKSRPTATERAGDSNACCARKSARTKSPRSSAPGPASR